MPKNRIGFSTDFNLTNSKVGIGTTNPRATLDVIGTLKGDFNISGVTTLTSYGGFIPQEQNILFDTIVGIKTVGVGTFTQTYETETGNLELVGQFNTVSEDIIVDEGKIFEITEDVVIGITTLGTQSYDYDTSTVSLGTLESVSIQSHFSVPDGGITERVDNPIEGSVRFNDDLNTLEFYNGVEWRQFTVTGASGRGVFGGGVSPVGTQSIDYITIATTGNAQNFGDLSRNTSNSFSACSSETRGVFGGGSPLSAPAINVLDYITISSEGNAIDFGDLYTASRMLGAISSSTRGIWAGGANPSLGGQINIIQYIQISTLGDSIDFGDLTSVKRVRDYRCSSSTRGVFGSGYASSGYTKTMDFVTISSTGNAVTFGDMLFSGGYGGGCSNAVRGVFGGGNSPTLDKTIQFITIATTGNATYFGDLSIAKQVGASCASSTRGIFAGGSSSPEIIQNVIEYITISTAGNAQDFGDLSGPRYLNTGLSDSHGGLGGF